MEYASNGKANAALTTGIIGTAGVGLGLLGNLLGLTCQPRIGGSQRGLHRLHGSLQALNVHAALLDQTVVMRPLTRSPVGQPRSGKEDRRRDDGCDDLPVGHHGTCQVQ